MITTIIIEIAVSVAQVEGRWVGGTVNDAGTQLFAVPHLRSSADSTPTLALSLPLTGDPSMPEEEIDSSSSSSHLFLPIGARGIAFAPCVGHDAVGGEFEIQGA